MFGNIIFYITFFITFLVVNLFEIKDPEQIKIIFNELKYPVILLIITIMYSTTTFFIVFKDLKTVKDFKYGLDEISIIKQLKHIFFLGIITTITVVYFI